MRTIFQRTEITEPALFTAFDTTKEIEDFPEICVSTFSETSFKAGCFTVQKNTVYPILIRCRRSQL